MINVAPDWFLMLGLAGLSALAVVVLLALKAAGCRKPGLGRSAVVTMLGMLVGLSLLAGWLHVEVPSVHVWNQPSWNNPVGFQLAGDQPPHWTNPMAQSQVGQTVGRISVVGLIVIVVLFVIVLQVIRRSFGTGNGCEQHRGGAWRISLLIALGFLLYFGIRSWNQEHMDLAHQRERVERERDQLRQHSEELRREAEEAAREVNEAGRESMQELWEEMNRPRIQLDTEHSSARMEFSQDGKTAVIEAQPVAETKVVVAHEDPVAQAAVVVTAAKDAEEDTSEVKEEEKQAAVEKHNEKPPAAEKRSTPIAAATGPLAGGSQERPAWVDQPPKRVGEVWREVVVAGEYETVDECYQAADDLLCVATWDHVQQLTGQDQTMESAARGNNDPASKLVRAPYARLALQRLGVGIDTIRREIVPDNHEYLETVERSFGPMKRLYTQLEFSPAVDRELRERWEAHERVERLMAVGGVGCLAIGVVGLAYGLLKVDTWTKGYYTKRLFLGVPAAIIGLVALAAAFIGP